VDTYRSEQSLGRRVAYRCLAVALGLALVLAGLEIAGRVLLLVRPSYEVVFLQPHRTLGWTLVPNLRFTWAGYHWWGPDFRVEAQANSEGFRDLERVRGPSDATRIALLGDSFVEAIQVPIEATAAQLLERRLNGSARAGTRFEVLNFGVSGYGVGQFLLTWEAHAREFSPQYVFALVGGLHLDRTVQRYEPGGFRSTIGEWLWVRPTFRLENGALVREPARDFERLVETQQRILREEFGPDRSRRRETSVFAHFTRPLWRRYVSREVTPRPPTNPPAPAERLAIGRAVLRELGRQVGTAGGRFVIVDAARYLDPQESSAAVSKMLVDLTAEEGFGYVPLTERLLAAERMGRATRWSRDAHFNRAGNEIFADALHEWLTATVPSADYRVPSNRISYPMPEHRSARAARATGCRPFGPGTRSTRT
jgi:hypothetical protein